MSSILQAYVAHLIGEGQHELVPQYCCHLRAGARHFTYQIFLSRLTSAPMADCQVGLQGFRGVCVTDYNPFHLPDLPGAPHQRALGGLLAANLRFRA